MGGCRGRRYLLLGVSSRGGECAEWCKGIWGVRLGRRRFLGRTCLLPASLVAVVLMGLYLSLEVVVGVMGRELDPRRDLLVLVLIEGRLLVLLAGSHFEELLRALVSPLKLSQQRLVEMR